jgi:hypothetical protein
MAGPTIWCSCTATVKCAWHGDGGGAAGPAIHPRAGDTEAKPLPPRGKGWEGDYRTFPRPTFTVPTIDRVAGRTKTEVMARVNALKADLHSYTEYLDLKRREGDWHGVQDAASDIRDVAAAVDALEWAVNEPAEPVR